jgi:thymidylate synthase (FAD)
MGNKHLISKKVDVGSHGFIKLVDVLGDDRRVVDAARISFGGESRGDDRDRNLLRYLMRNRHTSPFEQCEVVFIIKAPMDVWRQWIRHRMANVNEYSTRYTEAIDQFAETTLDQWRPQSSSNKQGSTDDRLPAEIGVSLSRGERQLQRLALEEYRRRLNEGVAKEQARKDLPLSTYTMAYWKSDLHNLLHFLELRMDKHAQLEIREFAERMYHDFIVPMFPWTCEAFEDYRLNAITFTGPELDVIRSIFVDLYQAAADNESLESILLGSFIGENTEVSHKLTKREKEDLVAKVGLVFDGRPL